MAADDGGQQYNWPGNRSATSSISLLKMYYDLD